MSTERKRHFLSPALEDSPVLGLALEGLRRAANRGTDVLVRGIKSPLGFLAALAVILVVPIVVPVLLKLFKGAEPAMEPRKILWLDNPLVIIRIATSIALAFGAGLFTAEPVRHRLRDLAICGIRERKVAFEHVLGRLIVYFPMALLLSIAAFIAFGWSLKHETGTNCWPGFLATCAGLLAAIVPQYVCLSAGLAIEAAFCGYEYARHFVAAAFFAVYLAAASLAVAFAEAYMRFSEIDMMTVSKNVEQFLYPFNLQVYALFVAMDPSRIHVSLGQYAIALSLDAALIIVFVFAAVLLGAKSMKPE